MAKTGLSDVLTVGEVAERLRVSRPVVREMLRRGQLPCVRAGRRVVRVPREAVEALIAGRKVRAS